MAVEISRSPKMDFLPAGVQAVHDGIVQAAISQEPESIEKAIRSFDWISGKGSYTDLSQKSLVEQTLPLSGFVPSPVEYLGTAGSGIAAGEIISADQVSAALRNPAFRIQQGVQSFLQSGIQESLASVKLKLGTKAGKPDVPESLNELMRMDQIKSLDASRFQPSLQAVNEMYSTLKRMQAGNNQLEINMLRIIRA